LGCHPQGDEFFIMEYLKLLSYASSNVENQGVVICQEPLEVPARGGIFDRDDVSRHRGIIALRPAEEKVIQ
jgi:hypothetical protein